MDITCKTVDEWLDSVSYADDPNYMPSDFALGFVAFIKLVNGGTGEENTTPVLHLRMLDQVSPSKNQRKVRIINMIHRGAGKTAVMAEYMFLYLATYGKIPNFGVIEMAIYVSDSIDNGVKNMRNNLQFRYENSEFLKKYIPQVRFTDIRYEFTNAQGNTFVVKAYGALTGVRGTKEMGKRPKLAILDDLVSDKDARSPTVIASIKDTVDKAVEYALHPSRSMVIWSGTPFNANDPLYTAVESGAWKVNVYPVCEKFPCAKEEFRGSWEDRFSYEYVSNQYERAVLGGRTDAFNQELMLRIMTDDDRLISSDNIRWFNRSSVIKNIGNFNIYLTTDFATSEKQSSDYSCQSVWAVNNNGDYYLIDLILKRQQMDKNLDDLFRLCQQYKPLSVGIEVTGQQGGFIPWIQGEMINRNVFFNLATSGNSNQAGIRPTTAKLQRFNVILPKFKAGKMYFPNEYKDKEEYKEAISQLKLTSAGGFKSKHDDFLDTVSMLPLMDVWYPSMDTPMVSSDGVYDEYVPTNDFSSSYIV